ncbi:E3 ubiquitin-protein ligase ZNF598 [Anopheles funestus]|uniref:E3 ubiquitin-protein ligase ZNF598 n=1 Tax=Anopheles funestus TaxID=62324 RepID=UPI0020C5C889|nr:E3 ubiquitin-protein ligase ZNF598 [Anopheles funestus]
MANNRQKIVQEKNVSEGETTEMLCVVCFKPIVYFAIGECDHLCCYECSTRIRVLCQQNDCPICRRDLAKVIFSKTLTPYQQLDVKNRSGLYDKKYRICFTDAEVQQAYYDLLDYKCPRCDQKNFPKFELLREHVRKQHELFYCDICTEHLKVFSSERRCYNRQELALHRRKGDPDKVGHRGHPLCEYCDTRFLDKDELFRHLRKDHFFCHYCDADGRNYFYGDYVSLRDHFRTDHFLCEEGECEQEQFTSVFRTEIDLRAHRASIHGKSMNRLANKQTRTLELEFTYAPRHGAAVAGGSGASHSGGAASGGGPSSNRGRGGRAGSATGRPVPPGSSGDMLQHEFDNLELANDHATKQHPKKVIDATNEQDFPTLGGSAPNPVFRPNNVTIRQRVYGAAGLARTKENFPALGSGGGEGTGPTSLNEGFSSKITASSLLKPSQPTATSGTSMMIHVSNRPAGSSGGKTNGASVASMVGKKSTSDFPALPGSGSKGSNKKTGGDIYADMDERSGGAAMVNLNAISAKHRALVDDYMSVSSVVSKVTTISSKDAKKQLSAPVQSSVPSVNSIKAFPTLGDGNKPASVKPLPWASGSATASNSGGGGSAASAGNTSGKKKPTPAPNLREEIAFVNLNALTGKKSAEKTKQKADSSLSNVADARNNNSELAQRGIGATKDPRNKEPQQKQQQHSKSNGQSSSANQTSHANNNNNPSSTLNNSFPVLGNANSVQFALAAGPKRTPPGFENVHVKRMPGPPPGFGNVTLNSVARNANNMTFTNSTGESYNILPTHSYVSPSNASKRNQVLVTHFQKALKNQEALMEFRTISQMFRDGQYEASAYYDHCKIALGDRFNEIFPELIALLPTIAKQQELYLVFCQDEKNKPKSTAKGKASNASKLEVCHVCKQVLIQQDLTEHYQTHYMENNFPKLGTNTADEGKVDSSAWKK